MFCLAVLKVSELLNPERTLMPQLGHRRRAPDEFWRARRRCAHRRDQQKVREPRAARRRPVYLRLRPLRGG